MFFLPQASLVIISDFFFFPLLPKLVQNYSPEFSNSLLKGLVIFSECIYILNFINPSVHLFSSFTKQHVCSDSELDSEVQITETKSQ